MMIRTSNRMLLPDLSLIAAFITLAVLYAILMISDRVPLPGIIFLCVLWLIYWVLGRRLSFATPVDAPIIILLALLPLSLFNTVDLSLTLPKVYGLVLGVVIFYWIVNYLRGISRLHVVILALVVLAAAIPVLGLLGADWSVSSYALPGRIAAGLTSRLGFLERLSSGGGIHVNTIGGTLAFFVPWLFCLLLDDGSLKRSPFFKRQPGKTFFITYKLTLASILALVVFVLFLTESRGSYLGSAVGVLALLVWKDRRFLWLIPVLLAVLILVFVFVANSDPAAFIALVDTEQENNTLQVRWDYWERTLYLIQDFPLTGAGLGTYNKIFRELYLFMPFASELEPSFYAHNLYLGITASMGIPALVLYFTLIGGFFSMVFASIKKVHPIARILLMGLSCGFLAHLIYGIMDNYLPGEKLGAVMWIFFGVITAIYTHQEYFAPNVGENISQVRQKNRVKFSRWLFFSFVGLISWTMISLAATTFINTHPVISLLVAAAGGITSGIILSSRFDAAMLAPASDKRITEAGAAPR